MKKLVFILLATGCASKASETLTAQAVEAHEKALNISKETASKIHMMTLLLDTLDIPSAAQYVDSLGVFKEEYHAWQADIVEVPGHEHAHHQHEGHHHHDAPDLTPEMMLEVQQVLLRSAEDLSERVHELWSRIASDIQ